MLKITFYPKKLPKEYSASKKRTMLKPILAYEKILTVKKIDFTLGFGKSFFPFPEQGNPMNERLGECSKIGSGSF